VSAHVEETMEKYYCVTHGRKQRTDSEIEQSSDKDIFEWQE